MQEFELTIDIDALLRDMDKDNSKTIDFCEFDTLLAEDHRLICSNESEQLIQ